MTDEDDELRAEDERLGDQLPLPVNRCGQCASTRGLSNIDGTMLCKPCRMLFAPLPMVLSENRTGMWVG